jgi:sugar phosphate isomerase/epimerase
MNRRDFMKSSAALAATATITPSFFLADKSTPIGLQLWSVRDAMAKDAVGTLKAVAKHGFTFVEGFGFKDGLWFGLTPGEMKKNLAGLGMTMPSAHQGMTTKTYDKSTKQLNDEFKKAVDAALEVGQKYVICPFMQDEDRNKESVKVLCEMFNKAGEYCKTKGLRFGYHNHDFEFSTRIDDAPMFKMLLDETDPKLVCFEMDMCWVVRGKYNPVDWFKLYPGRFELSHIKDLADQSKSESAIVGTGIVDFKQVIANQKIGGMKHWIVELEHYTKDGSVADVGVSYKNLRKIL